MATKVGPVGRPQVAPTQARTTGPRSPGFEEALTRAQQTRPPAQPDGIRFSAHAVQRLQAHGMAMDDGIQERLSAAVTMARAKGIRETLVVTREASWIVSVPNQTVITVVPRGAVQGDVFSQIDGAVILD